MQLPWADPLIVGDPGPGERAGRDVGGLDRTLDKTRSSAMLILAVSKGRPFGGRATDSSIGKNRGRDGLTMVRPKLSSAHLYPSLSLIGQKPSHRGNNEQPVRPSVLLPPHDWRPETLGKNPVTKSLEQSEAKRRMPSREMRLITVSGRKASCSVMARISTAARLPTNRLGCLPC